jgi:prepilin signal peptidase PulO-like enzyme (type II secretory pathway)
MFSKKIILRLIFTVLLLALSFPVSAQMPNVGPSSIQELFTSIGQFLFALLIPLATLAIIWSGVMLITAGGNEDRVKKGRAWLLWAIIGLAVGLIGYGLVNLIQSILGAR